jgi:ABC-type multidrug transport system, ATPase component
MCNSFMKKDCEKSDIPLLEVRGISKKFGKYEVLSDISFVLNKGEILVLLGENGAGKSTLLSVLTTLLKPDTGNVMLAGQSIIKTPKAAKGRIAYVPQEAALHNNLNVRDNLGFWAAMSGLAGKDKKTAVEKIMQDFSLVDYAKIKAGKLSVGLRRRVSIAAALFGNVELMVMDEPTAGLDVSSATEIIIFVKRLRENGIAVVYVTHISDEIDILADKILHISKGIGSCYESPEAYRGAIDLKRHV